MPATPSHYVLAWDDYPRQRDLGRFLAAQLSDLLDKPVSIEAGEAIIDLLEDAGELGLSNGVFRIPLLGRGAGESLLAQAMEAATDDDSAPTAMRRPRVRVTPASLSSSAD